MKKVKREREKAGNRHQVAVELNKSLTGAIEVNTRASLNASFQGLAGSRGGGEVDTVHKPEKIQFLSGEKEQSKLNPIK